MAANISEILSRLKAKVEVLTQRYEVVKNQRDEALEQCRELTDRLESVSAALQKSQTENEYLRISHKIAPSADDARESQDVIAGLIKKIDKCISQLRED